MHITKFKGLSNKQDPLVTGPEYLDSAINVEVDDTNSVRRRFGFEPFATFSEISASYCIRNKQDSYLIADNKLILLSDMSVKIDSVQSGDYIFDDFEDNLFVYGPDKFRVQSGRKVEWEIPVCPQPKVEIVDGSQPAGIYQITAVYRNHAGLEGGTNSPMVVQVPIDSAFNIEVEQILDHSVTIYVSPPNGKYMYQWINTSASNNVWDGPLNLLVSPLNVDQLGASPVPYNCSHIAYHQSRVYLSEYLSSENKSVVWFSKPFSYHLFNKSRDYFVIEGQIRALIDVDGALVVCTAGSIYYYSDGNLKQVAHYGIPDGKPYDRNEDGKVFLYSNRGICLLNEFANITELVYNFPISSKVSSAIIERDGFERMINLLSDSSPAPNTFRS